MTISSKQKSTDIVWAFSNQELSSKVNTMWTEYCDKVNFDNLEPEKQQFFITLWQKLLEKHGV